MYMLAPERIWSPPTIGQQIKDLLEGSIQKDVDKLQPFQAAAAFKQCQVGVLEASRGASVLLPKTMEFFPTWIW